MLSSQQASIKWGIPGSQQNKQKEMQSSNVDKKYFGPHPGLSGIPIYEQPGYGNQSNFNNLPAPNFNVPPGNDAASLDADPSFTTSGHGDPLFDKMLTADSKQKMKHFDSSYQANNQFYAAGSQSKPPAAHDYYKVQPPRIGTPIPPARAAHSSSLHSTASPFHEGNTTQNIIQAAGSNTNTNNRENNHSQKGRDSNNNKEAHKDKPKFEKEHGKDAKRKDEFAVTENDVHKMAEHLENAESRDVKAKEHEAKQMEYRNERKIEESIAKSPDAGFLEKTKAAASILIDGAKELKEAGIKKIEQMKADREKEKVHHV